MTWMHVMYVRIFKAVFTVGIANTQARVKVKCV